MECTSETWFDIYQMKIEPILQLLTTPRVKFITGLLFHKGSLLQLSHNIQVYNFFCVLSASFQECMCKRYRCTDKLNKHPKDAHERFVSASAPFTHAWIPEKNRLILIILQCNAEHKNVFSHITGLKIAQIKIPRNVVDDFGTWTTRHHMKTSTLKRKDQLSFGFVDASMLMKFS